MAEKITHALSEVDKSQFVGMSQRLLAKSAECTQTPTDTGYDYLGGTSTGRGLCFGLETDMERYPYG